MRLASGLRRRGAVRVRTKKHAAGVDLSASAEPFILPGESLVEVPEERWNGKRQRDEEAARGKRDAEALDGGSPLVGWDGGATLPGETLARHRDERSEGDRGAAQ